MGDNRKKKFDSDKETNQSIKRSKITCEYGEKCYRRNPSHFSDYEHPHLDNLLKQDRDKIEIPKILEGQKSVILEQLEILRNIRGAAQSQLPQQSSPKKVMNSKVQSPSPSKKLDKPTTVSSKTSTHSRISLDDVSTFFKSSQNPLKNKNSQSASSSSFQTSSSQSTSYNNSRRMNTKQKLEKAAPYNIFFTTVSDCPETWSQENAITFKDLLCPSLGTLKASLQINFMIDIMWLMEQYDARGVGDIPLTAFFGYEFPGMKEYMAKQRPNVTHYFVPMKDPFGTHHSKMGIYVYTDGSLRVVVSTANLYYEDWNLYAQGLWISPLCPKLPDSATDADGCGPTDFKGNLLTYLKSYNVASAKEWIEYVKRADFSEVKVFMVMSIPGKHYQNQNTGCHHQRVGDLLRRHCVLPAKDTEGSKGPQSWPIIAQASSIGNLGKTAEEWLRGVFLRALSPHSDKTLACPNSAVLKVIFPSRANVLGSYKGEDGGGCLPYGKAAHEKQKWFTSYLHQWKADRTKRTRSMPHIKSYCRVSPCGTKLAYYLITSANISKAAWGNAITKKDASTYVRSYEVGVMFFPKFFDEKHFVIANDAGSSASSSGLPKKLFPFIYDMPLTPYGPGDEPWTQ